MVLMVCPKNPRIIKDMNMDMGMAKPTNKALRKPKKNINTVMTSSTPKMMLLAKSLTKFLVALDWSFEMSTSMVVGKSFFSTSATMALIFSTVWIRFLPLRFLMSSTSAVFPSERAKEFFSFSLKEISAMSPMYTVPFWFFNTNFSKSSGRSISPITRRFLRRPLPSMFPAETVLFPL